LQSNELATQRSAEDWFSSGPSFMIHVAFGLQGSLNELLLIPRPSAFVQYGVYRICTLDIIMME